MRGTEWCGSSKQRKTAMGAGRAHRHALACGDGTQALCGALGGARRVCAVDQLAWGWEIEGEGAAYLGGARKSAWPPPKAVHQCAYGAYSFVEGAGVCCQRAGGSQGRWCGGSGERVGCKGVSRMRRRAMTRGRWAMTEVRALFVSVDARPAVYSTHLHRRPQCLPSHPTSLHPPSQHASLKSIVESVLRSPRLI